MYCLLFPISVHQLATWSRVLTEKLTVAHNRPESLQLSYILEVYWCVQKTLQLVPLFSQINLNGIPTPCFFNLSSNIVLPSMPGSSKCLSSHQIFQPSCSLSSHRCVLHAVPHSPAFGYLIVIVGHGLRDRGITVLISGRGRILSVFQSVQTSSGALPTSYSVGDGSSLFWSKVAVEWSWTPEAAFEGGKWGDRHRPRSWGGPALQA